MYEQTGPIAAEEPEKELPSVGQIENGQTENLTTPLTSTTIPPVERIDPVLPTPSEQRQEEADEVKQKEEKAKEEIEENIREKEQVPQASQDNTSPFASNDVDVVGGTTTHTITDTSTMMSNEQFLVQKLQQQDDYQKMYDKLLISLCNTYNQLDKQQFLKGLQELLETKDAFHRNSLRVEQQQLEKDMQKEKEKVTELNIRICELEKEVKKRQGVELEKLDYHTLASLELELYNTINKVREVKYAKKKHTI